MTKLKKVFSVRGNISRERLEQINSNSTREHKQFQLFVAADNASEALKTVSDYMADFLKEHEHKGFDSIEISQSHTEWLLADPR